MTNYSIIAFYFYFLLYLVTFFSRLELYRYSKRNTLLNCMKLSTMDVGMFNGVLAKLGSTLGL